MKKFISLSLIFSLLFTMFSFSIVSAGENKKEEATKIAKSFIKDRLGIDIDDDIFKYTIEYISEEGKNSKSGWFINYYTENAKNVSINLFIDEISLKITELHMNKYDYNDDKYTTSFSYDEGVKIALDNITKINPELAGNIELVNEYPLSNSGSKDYFFRFLRKENGAFYENNYINVNLNGKTKEIMRYEFYWDYNAKLNTSPSIISSEKAIDVFKKNVDTKLKYIEVMDRVSKKTNVKAVYELAIDGYVDANGNYNAFQEQSFLDLNEDEKEDFLSVYKEDENLKLSEQEVREYAIKCAKELGKKDYKIDSIRYIENNDTFYWSVVLIHSDDKRAYIDIDGKSKCIINFNDYDNEFSKKNVSFEDGYKTSIDLIKTYYPAYVNNIDTKVVKINEEQKDSYIRNYSFEGIVNGISFERSRLNIGIDSNNRVVSMNSSIVKELKDAPSVDSFINENDAKEKLFKEYMPVACYLDDNIVYYLRSSKGYDIYSSTLDAQKGVLINYSGNAVSYSDEFKEKIKDSYAKEEINNLYSMGIIDESFNPYEKSTKMEVIKMLVNSKRNTPTLYRESAKMGNAVSDVDNFRVHYNDVAIDDANYDYVKLAINYGIIENVDENLNPSQNVSKEDLAKVIVKYLGYNHLATADVYALKFKDAKDISKDALGHLAICKALNIITGSEDNMLYPKSYITNEQLAKCVFKMVQYNNM